MEATRRRQAFTLVELLVVIGIIALLIAILLPTLKKAQDQARSVSCLSNMRQMHFAFSMYNNDHKGKSFFYRADYPTFWMSQLLKYQGKSAKIRVCPETQEPSFGWGSVWKHWGPDFSNPWMQEHTGSYCFNGWLYRLFPDGSGGGQNHAGVTAAEARDHFMNLPTKEAANVPVFADSTWVDAWPRETDAPPLNPMTEGSPPFGTGPGYMMRRVTVPRHMKMSGAVFLDGSARRVPLREMYQLKWSKKFVPRTDVRIPGY
jgi:prepilin-type N-terminal cleavage/methylation domain-containing protein